MVGCRLWWHNVKVSNNIWIALYFIKTLLIPSLIHKIKFIFHCTLDENSYIKNKHLCRYSPSKIVEYAIIYEPGKREVLTPRHADVKLPLVRSYSFIRSSLHINIYDIKKWKCYLPTRSAPRNQFMNDFILVSNKNRFLADFLQ